jgi:hypothetical protein
LLIKLASNLFIVARDIDVGIYIRVIHVVLKMLNNLRRSVSKYLLFGASPCSGGHVKSLVPAAFAVITTLVEYNDHDSS